MQYDLDSPVEEVEWILLLPETGLTLQTSLMRTTEVTFLYFQNLDLLKQSILNFLSQNRAATWGETSNNL